MTVSSIVPFDFEGLAVRTVIRAGEPWFILADICRALEVGNPSDAARRLDDDEKGVITNDTPGGAQEMILISNEGGRNNDLGSEDEKGFHAMKTPGGVQTGNIISGSGRGDPDALQGGHETLSPSPDGGQDTFIADTTLQAHSGDEGMTLDIIEGHSLQSSTTTHLASRTVAAVRSRCTTQPRKGCPETVHA